MEEIREALPEEIIATPTETVKPKKKRTPAPPTRTMEDLDGIAPKKMTDKEKDLYIEELRRGIQEIAEINSEWKDQTKSAFERARQAEEDAKRVRDSANFKLTAVKDTIRVMTNNIMTILEK